MVSSDVCSSSSSRRRRAGHGEELSRPWARVQQPQRRAHEQRHRHAGAGRRGVRRPPEPQRQEPPPQRRGEQGRPRVLFSGGLGACRSDRCRGSSAMKRWTRKCNVSCLEGGTECACECEVIVLAPRVKFQIFGFSCTKA